MSNGRNVAWWWKSGMRRELYRYCIRHMNGTYDKRLCMGTKRPEINGRSNNWNRFFCSTFWFWHFSNELVFYLLSALHEVNKKCEIRLLAFSLFRLSTNFLTFNLDTDESLVLKFKYDALLVIQRRHTTMPYDIGCINYGIKPAYSPFLSEK